MLFAFPDVENCRTKASAPSRVVTVSSAAAFFPEMMAKAENPSKI